MLFHTWVFFVFFLIVYPVYLLVRNNNRLMNVWLMIASYTFYGWWNPWYLLLLFGTSAIDYLMVLLMERKQSTRKLWLVISLVSNFGFLGLLQILRLHHREPQRLPDAAWHWSVPAARPGRLSQHHARPVRVPDDWFFKQVVLPIGISFHTFQSMSYTIDAYRGHRSRRSAASSAS